MPRCDTLIRNGLIVDGTGAAPFYGDVAVVDGKISAVGRLSDYVADREIDARGYLVAPGYVTQHSHYDAMMFWNPYCSNSGENGVTTVVNGNCGFGFAPVRAADRERAMAMMETTEQIPVSHQKAALPWDWETFPEYLARVRSIPKGINHMAYLPVNPLMIYVMGVDAAKSRRPTQRELQEMHQIINEAMDAGAMGISMSVMGAEGNSHVDFDGSPMPTDAMDPEVAVEISRAVADRGEGVIQIISQIAQFGDRTTTERIARMAKGSGARVAHNIFLTSDDAPQMVDDDLAWLTSLREEGLDVTAQTLWALGWNEGGIRDLDVAAGQFAGVREIVGCKSDEQLISLITNPDFRTRFQKEFENFDAPNNAAGFERLTVVGVGENAELQRHLGKTIGEVAKELNKDVVPTLLDLALESNLKLETKSLPYGSTDPRQALKLMRHTGVTAGVSDGGAHTKTHSLGFYGTDLLVWIARESKLATVEELHYHLGLKAAQAMLVKDRGAILPGFWADLLVYKLDELYIDKSRMEIVHDMPNGDWRRRVRAGGYHRILVNGVVTHEDDKPTGSTPGVFVQVTRQSAAA